MKKFKLMFLTACLLTGFNLSFANENLGTECTVSSTAENNWGSCWPKPEGGGNDCYRTDATPVCNGSV